MGSRRYPSLTPSEVIAILRELNFYPKRQDGSHAQWERLAEGSRTRALVTVDVAESDFSEPLMKSMIRQSGFTREEFYGATKKTAKKIGGRAKG
jgi:predicted RNA binding protein YcfA (HicA-like mRNA interferase family)